MPPPLVQHLCRTFPSVARVGNKALLSVTGSQATEFLNGILATSIHPRLNQYSSVLHPQGRVMYDVFIFATDNGFLLEYDSRTSEATPLLSYLKRHVLRSKVKLRDATEEYDVWAAWGFAQDKVWETKRDWSWARSGVVEPVWHKSDAWPWGTQEGVIQDRRAVGMGHRLLLRKGDIPQEASSHDIVTPEDYLLHRILHGVPEGCKEIVPMQSFPMDSNLDVMGGLNFRKGCYVGQELTVRTYHTGMIRKRILPVFTHEPNVQELSALSPSFSLSSIEIKPSLSARAQTNTERPTPRPRGSGKLLCAQDGVGLALLRLDHVDGIEKGDLRLEFVEEGGGSKRLWEVTPWWPDWWPSSRPDNGQ